MILAHLADLHIGRRFGEFDLIEDQRYILKEILNILKKEAVDIVMISGDVYDKVSPSAQAFSLWNDFLTSLDGMNVHVLVTSGNHDSSDRLGVASQVLAKHKIHIESEYKGSLKKLQFTDKYGTINIFMLPFIKASTVRNTHKDFDDRSTDEAVGKILEDVTINSNERNILMAHQFVIGSSEEPVLSESEVKPVGGTDFVNTSVFSDFDYVALGHIHRPQRISRDTVRYSGSPLKYSFSEWQDKKSIPILKFTDSLDINFIPLVPMRDVRIIEGPFEKLMDIGLQSPSDDLIHAIITDEVAIYNPINQLRSVYPNVLSLEINNSRTQNKQSLKRAKNILKQDKLVLISDFFKKQNNRDLNQEELDYLNTIMERMKD